LTLLAWSRAWVLAGANRLSQRQVICLLGVWATPLTLGPPILSLDVYSYAAHGVMLTTGLDPYRAVPAALPLNSPVLAAVDPLWRFARAPYGPLAEGIFALVQTVARGNLIVIIIILRLLALIGVVLIAVGAAALAPALRRAEALVLAALNPIVLFQLLGAVHLEALMMGLTAMGLLAVHRQRPTAGLALLAAATAIKWPAALAVLAVVAWRAAGPPDSSPGSAGPPGERPRPVRTLLTIVHDLGVVAIATIALAAVVPDGFGWLSAVATPSTVPTQYSPTSIAADLLGRLSASLGGTSSSGHFLEIARLTGLAVTGGIVAWLLLTVRLRSVAATAGWAMLALALLGPVLHPWYLAWGFIPLAIAPTRRQRRAVLMVTAAGTFLALQHCSLLFADDPMFLRWLRAHASVFAVVSYVVAAAIVRTVTRRRTSPAPARQEPELTEPEVEPSNARFLGQGPTPGEPASGHGGRG
jgi:alpha-1,6-mannosyltransferase